MLGAGLTGCEWSVPPSSRRLAHAGDSPGQVTQRALDALADADAEALARLAISEEEFRDVVWPELPSSRPERNLTVDYVWADLHQKSRGYMLTLLDAHRGRRFEFVEIRFDGGTTEYHTYRVHRNSHVTFRTESGDTVGGRFFGAMIEMGGQFKIFSFVID